MKKAILNLASIAGLCTFAFMFYASGDVKKDKASGSQSGSDIEEKTENKKDVEILKSSATYEPYMKAYTVHCRIKNNTNKLISYLDLTATYYDKSGKIVGTGMGNCVNLPAGEERTVDVMGLDISNKATYEVEVGTVMFD